MEHGDADSRCSISRAIRWTNVKYNTDIQDPWRIFLNTLVIPQHFIMHTIPVVTHHFVDHRFEALTLELLPSHLVIFGQT